MDNFTQEELDYLKKKVKYVIFLLDASIIPNEIKTAWVTLMPHMTLDQVDRLCVLLEKEIEQITAQAKKQPEDEEFVLKVKEAKKRYDISMASINQKTMAKIKAIEQSLPAYE